MAADKYLDVARDLLRGSCAFEKPAPIKVILLLAWYKQVARLRLGQPKKFFSAANDGITGHADQEGYSFTAVPVYAWSGLYEFPVPRERRRAFPDCTARSSTPMLTIVYVEIKPAQTPVPSKMLGQFKKS